MALEDHFKCLECNHEFSVVFIPNEDGLTCPKCGSYICLVIKNTPRIPWQEENDGGTDR